ncbi:putative protein kinase [Blattamonas nauphoetae]|uniref:Non-specific serine/threonine protein kinase n=1 Tax=Blattamonas nauphoetae TaxID=2049346 RepID=A0ABQ9X5G0_9EUKA|nr:putative protein kinase [Blattamonas nauphoetae]
MSKFNIFKTNQQKLTPEQSKHLFETVKTNKYGKTQKRQLSIAADGVRNCDGQNVQWHYDNDHVLSLKIDPNNPTNVTMVVVSEYSFTTTSADQAAEIVRISNELNIGTKEKRDKIFKLVTPPEELAAMSVPDKSQDTPHQPPSDTSETTKSPSSKMAPVPPPQNSTVPLGLSLTSDANTTSLADFELILLVGKGSFGKVLQVRHKPSNKIYALKILRKYELYQRGQQFHTLTERTILATVKNPFMPQLHYAFQTQHKLYMVIDYANGGELFFHLRRAGTFPEILATFYLAEICSTINALHSHSIIYRDLKPENVLLDSEGHIMITDFGLAKIGITAMGGDTDAGKVGTGTFCGTPEYLAPEILRGVPHGQAVDWWSVGILYYEMLAGAPPFYSANRNQMYQNTLHGDLVMPDTFTAQQRDFLERILARDPQERLGSGETGGEEIMNHPLFAGMDWEKLNRREIPPPFKPQLDGGIMDTTNIDPQFFAEPAVDSPPQSPTGLTSEIMEAMNKDYIGFDFNQDL